MVVGKILSGKEAEKKMVEIWGEMNAPKVGEKEEADKETTSV